MLYILARNPQATDRCYFDSSVPRHLQVLRLWFIVTDEEGGLFSLFIAYQPNIAHIGSYEIVAELEDAMMKFDTFFFTTI